MHFFPNKLQQYGGQLDIDNMHFFPSRSFFTLLAAFPFKSPIALSLAKSACERIYTQDVADDDGATAGSDVICGGV